MIKEGDVVELLPNTNRHRQLRAQEGKHEWVVLKIDPDTICFGGSEGFYIESCIDRKHTRWVQRTDIELIELKENRR